MKAIIIGNSGSGKTWLAAHLAASCGAVVTHLDDLFWEPGGFDVKRGASDVADMVARSKLHSAWVVEGVFGDLAKRYAADADLLVWLDPDWIICRQRLLARGSQSKAHMDRSQSQAGLDRLIQWASGYASSMGSCSQFAHQRLFDAFAGRRLRLRSVHEVDALLGAGSGKMA